MERKTKHNRKSKEGSKRKMRDNNVQDNVQQHEHSKILYNKKFSTPMTKKRKNAYDPEEEARLESIVFGEPNNFINNLLKKEPMTETKDNEPNDNYHEKLISNKKVNLDHDNSSTIDDTEDANLKEKKAVWKDDDDYNYTVNEALEAQNRSLACERPEKSYATYLKNHYKIFVGTSKWADSETTNKVQDEDSDVLKHCRHTAKPSKPQRLPKDIIDIKILMSLNKNCHAEGPVVTSVEFHPKYALALIAGTSGIFSVYQVDGHTNCNRYRIRCGKFPISKASFIREGTEVLIGSRYYRSAYTFNLNTEQLENFLLPHGITNMKYFEVSPDGKFIAICGRGGEIFLLTSSTKELICKFNMNFKCRALAFTPDNKTLISHGDGGEMYIWDLNTRMCVHRAVDEGCLSGSALAVSANGQYVATGSTHGVVNVYETKTVLQTQNPAPLKVMMNLVTSITSLKFNPTCEILAAASDKKYNAFKMMHIPSFRVFTNFPGFQTDIGMPQSIAFSPRSGFLSISNKTGSALLYRLRHYDDF